ncbi:hydrogen peroxide-inducible genes activator [Flavobacterium album]|uniref:Hydrogen peroxide-inducible genes activator n=1 Tax=Flavobacterium album TaxID=2175091 RepID=A0A2S1QYM7_9FLAO|nr:hydrogen peroxide-inducible genes activator [Flavobacterium album]AWH85498.1 hydrogen peroxide-inducible genes activator [Flavobacterium album]
MTLQQLRYIIALDEHRHFAKAAEVCMVTQPGLTIQLKNLEEELGIKIFDRDKVPLKPTLAGREIIIRARKTLHEVDGIRDFVIGQKDDLEGTVTLGVISTLSPYLIPQFMKEVRTRAPKMHFIIKEMNTSQLIESVLTGAIDVALMATPTGHLLLREHVVFNEPFVAFLNEGHAMGDNAFYEIKPGDTQNLLLLRQEYCFNAQLLDICGINKGNEFMGEQFNYDISSVETLKNMVRAGLGFAIVPELSLAHDADAHYKRFKEPAPSREISLVVSDNFIRKLLLEKMKEAIWEVLPASLKEGKKYRRIQWNDSPYFINAVSSLK